MTPILASQLDDGRYVLWVLATCALLLIATTALLDIDLHVRRVWRWWQARQVVRRSRPVRDLDAVCRHDRQRRALERACTKREGR